MQFTAKLSKDIKITTWVTFVVLGMLPFELAFFLRGSEGSITALLSFIGFPLFCIFLVGYFILKYQVLGYSLELDTLVIKRRWDMVSFSLAEIEAVESDKEFKRSIRVFGIGGVLGIYGKFKTIGGPTFTAYVTDSKNRIVIKTTEGRIVISPHERELFLDTLAALRPDLPIGIK